MMAGLFAFAPAGCSGSKADSAASLTEAFNYTGTYPTPTKIAYTAMDGNTYNLRAFPGQVAVILNSANTSSMATKLIEANSGKVIAQIPKAGMYWASVTAGTEAKFISAVSKESFVVDAFPSIAIGGRQEPVDLSGATSMVPIIPPSDAMIAQIDLDCASASDDSKCNNISHLAGVKAIAEQNGQTVSSYDTCTNMTEENLLNIGIGDMTNLAFGLSRIADGAVVKGQRLVVNLSLGPEFHCCISDLPSCQPTSSECEALYTTADALNENRIFLAQIAQTMEALSDTALDNTAIVIASGNDGLDLTEVLAEIKVSYPRAWNHLFLAGALDEDGNVYKGFNYSTNSGDMIYRQGVGVAMPGMPECLLNGTSFCAPQVSEELAQALQEAPATKTSTIRTQVTQANCAANGKSCAATSCCSGLTCQASDKCGECADNGASCDLISCCPGYQCKSGKCGLPCTDNSGCLSGCCSGGFCTSVSSCRAVCEGNGDCLTNCCDASYCTDASVCQPAQTPSGGTTIDQCTELTELCSTDICGGFKACSKCTINAAASGSCKAWYQTGSGSIFSCTDFIIESGQTPDQTSYCTAAAQALYNSCCPEPEE